MRFRPLFRASLLLPALLAFPRAASADDSKWSGRFGLGVLENANGQAGGTAYAVAVDSLYVYFGGTFAKVSGLRVNNIVRIHRKTGRIERLGNPDSCGVNGQVRVIKPHPGGGVYVGGSFTRAGVDSAGQGGVETGPLALFTGSGWGKAGPMISAGAGAGLVTAIDYSATAIYVAGGFTKAGDVEATNIAALKDFVTWEPLWDEGRIANGVAGIMGSGGLRIAGLVVTNDGVHVGGNFDVAGGRVVVGAAHWDWQLGKWDNMKGGMAHAGVLGVTDMDRDHAQGVWVASKGVLKYADTGWIALEGSENSTINRVVATTHLGLLAYGSGGDLFSTSPLAFYNEGIWTHADVKSAGFTLSGADVDFAADEDRIWIGSNGGLQGANGIAWYDGKTFGVAGNGLRATRSGGLSINDFAEFEGKAIVAGSFSHLGSTAAEGIARWTGETWEAMGEGYQNVWKLAVFKDRLYAGGSLNRAGQSAEGSLARWTGSAWEIVPGFEAATGVSGMAATSKYLWISSDGFRDGNARAPLGRWDGEKLEFFGKEISSAAQIDLGSIVPWGDEGACVSGFFNKVGAEAAPGVACFDGTAWAPLGGALVSGNVTSLAAVGNALYAGCSCTFPGGAKNLARWDGKEWKAVDGEPDGMVLGLRANGGDLYVVGNFQKVGDVKAAGVARWDGKEWSPVGSGLTPATANRAWVGPGGLWLAGSFTLAGGVPSRNIALYGGVEKQDPLPMGVHRQARKGKELRMPARRFGRTGVEFGVDGATHRADGRALNKPPRPAEP